MREASRPFWKRELIFKPIAHESDRVPTQTQYVHVEAALALDIHEVGVGGRYQPLQLVLPLLQLLGRVQKIDIAREHLWAIAKRVTIQSRTHTTPASAFRF